MKNRNFVYLGIAGVLSITVISMFAQSNLAALGVILCYGIAPICGIVFTDFWFVTKPQEGVVLRMLMRWDVLFSWICSGIIAYGVGCALSGAVFGGFIYWVTSHFILRLKHYRNANLA